ncbi:O-methyltransferase gsfC [Lasiodiplodia hormozganensis]|uniref:O-methyltransferase gsfC n=1 Tax=Lasiodiplodia hormozganensis TaxID=869390 RepID=A0AA39XYB0_9PEZI|nr:O-methyltransferase gsfC [Lasiodiplodia hormozganensis]
MSSPSSNQVDLENLAGDLTSAIRAFKDAPRSSTDAVLKRRLVTQLAKNIITEIEEPGERPFEYVAQMAELATLRILMEWRALEHIPPTGSITYAELATKISADTSLIRRLCWPLIASELLAQPAPDAVAHTAASRCFTNDNPQGAYFKIFYDTITPSAVAWPRWAASHGRTPPVEPSDNPFTWGHGAPTKSYWELASGAMQVDMNTSMQSLDTLLPVNGAYPFGLISERAGDVAPDAALVVDVGGGRGQAIERMREECPEITAERCVLQDTAEVIADVGVEREGEGLLEGVRRMVVDYFEEQPVKGALVYLLRRIMHDWSDKYCVRILERLRDAMAEYSRILIMDQILDDPPNRTCFFSVIDGEPYCDSCGRLVTAYKAIRTASINKFPSNLITFAATSRKHHAPALEEPHSYRYSPLSEKGEIRLMVLNPGKWHDELHCTLAKADLNDLPRFDAASYTWADERGCKDKLARIWCGDYDEKQLFDDFGGNTLSAPDSRMTTETYKDALARLMRRPWFGRMWVIQELLLAPRGVWICGNKAIDLGRLERMGMRLGHGLPPFLELKRTPREKWSLWSLLQMTRGCRAEDPRDRVYALLGLVPDVVEAKLVPDYSKSVHQVYTDTAAFLVDSYRSPNVLFLRDAPRLEPERASEKAHPV